MVIIGKRFLLVVCLFFFSILPLWRFPAAATVSNGSDTIESLTALFFRVDSELDARKAAQAALDGLIDRDFYLKLRNGSYSKVDAFTTAKAAKAGQIDPEAYWLFVSGPDHHPPAFRGAEAVKQGLIDRDFYLKLRNGNYSQGEAFTTAKAAKAGKIDPEAYWLFVSGPDYHPDAFHGAEAVKQGLMDKDCYLTSRQTNLPPQVLKSCALSLREIKSLHPATMVEPGQSDQPTAEEVFRFLNWDGRKNAR